MEIDPPSYSVVERSDTDLKLFLTSLSVITRKKKDLEKMIIKNENEQKTLYLKINSEKDKMKESTMKLTGLTVRREQVEEEWRKLKAEYQTATE